MDSDVVSKDHQRLSGTSSAGPPAPVQTYRGEGVDDAGAATLGAEGPRARPRACPPASLPRAHHVCAQGVRRPRGPPRGSPVSAAEGQAAGLSAHSPTPRRTRARGTGTSALPAARGGRGVCARAAPRPCKQFLLKRHTAREGPPGRPRSAGATALAVLAAGFRRPAPPAVPSPPQLSWAWAAHSPRG